MGLRTLLVCLAIVIMGDSAAFARMLHRSQFKPRQGYNTGTGRMEAHDRIIAIEVDSLPIYQMSRIQSSDGKVSEKYILAMDYNLSWFALTPEVAYSNFSEGKEESGNLTELNAVEAKAQLARYSDQNRLYGWYGRLGYIYRNVYGVHQPYVPSTLLDETLPEPLHFAGVSHGATAAAGHRWTFFENHASLSAGVGYTQHLKQDGDLTGKSEEANCYYQASKIADYTIKREHYPEFHLRLGLLF